MDFAIVGMDCLLPGALTVQDWLDRTEPAIGPVPEGRWPMSPTSHTDPEPGALDRATNAVGGFVEGFTFRDDDLALDEVPVEELDPLLQWTLHVTRGALSQARADRSKTGLFLANLSLPSTGAIKASAAPYLDALEAAGIHIPWLEGGEPWDRWQSGFPAALAASALGLGGGATALDAACASGLYAVKLACDRLAAGEVDAAIAAGVQHADSAYLFLGFSQLRALSATGTARPLAANGDGLVVGEGAAAVLIKRLDDALADGDTIHAVLKGGGLGNDGRSGNMLAPQTGGQQRTLKTAWQAAGIQPAALGYIECHATGTPLGDATEVNSLLAAIEASDEAPEQPIALSSAKALIGHTITVAGLAGLIRAVGAVRDGHIPPAVSVDAALPVIADSSHLRLAPTQEPWPEGVPRRAGVSAFGFGGTNAHLIVEQAPAKPKRKSRKKRRKSKRAPFPKLAIVGIGAQIGGARNEDLFGALAQGDDLREPATEAITRGLASLPEGAYVQQVAVDPRRYRIPPVELRDMLPQQLLMLEAAADAVEDAGSPLAPNTASIVGMGLDHHIGEAVIRWAVQGATGRNGDDIAPALTAQRVQGSLPNFVANRIAAQLDLQGPSYTTSAGALSGLYALRQAADLLEAGEVDAAIVGASDLSAHVGAFLAAESVLGEVTPGEGAIAFVVKRLEDAEAAGDRIYAVIRGLGFADDPDTAAERARVPVDAEEFEGDEHHPLTGFTEALDGTLALLYAMVQPNEEGPRSVLVETYPDSWAAVWFDSREWPEAQPRKA